MTSQSASPFTAREFRDALGLFPTGVAVVTALSGAGEKLGVTVSSFSSVSLDPPLVSFGLAKSAHSFDDWVAAPHFAINVLTEEQEHLSTKFARALSDKWSGLSPRRGTAAEVPLLDEALAWFECAKFAQHDAGDHLIVLGRILSFARTPHEGRRPLVFFRSAYHRLHGSEFVKPAE